MFREVDFKNKYKSNVYFIMVNDIAHRRRRRRDNSTAATTISATQYSPFIIRHTVVTLHRHTMQCIHILYVARVPHDMIETELERFEKKNRIK